MMTAQFPPPRSIPIQEFTASRQVSFFDSLKQPRFRIVDGDTFRIDDDRFLILIIEEKAGRVIPGKLDQVVRESAHCDNK